MGVYAKDFIKSEDESGCKWSEEVWFRPFPYCHFLRGSCRGAEKCPLIEVPEPHGRLIDASEKIRVQIYDDMTEDYHMVEMTIDDLLCQGWVEANAPTIIPASEEAE